MRYLFLIITVLSMVNCKAIKENSINNSSQKYTDTIQYKELGIESHKICEVTKDLDLKGKVLPLPEGVTLKYSGGILKNGLIIGNDSKIESSCAIFRNISIQGTWKVPMIRSSIFFDCDDINCLKNVFALTNPQINNRVVIEEGKYYVEARKEGDVCLSIETNTDVVLNGQIILIPNSFNKCSIIKIEGKNVTLKGRGRLVGDKQTHTGFTGEWGMGLTISNGRNVEVTGLTIKDCWGDCIYINQKSKDIAIDSCFLDNGRRQGISLIDADGVAIRNCKITNVGGTNPQYGIDLEPNSRNYVDNVVIENVTINNCVGGITTLGRKRNRKDIQIGSVEIRNCNISSTKRRPLNLRTCKKAVAENCVIHSPGDVSAVYVEGIDDLTLRNNEITHDKSLLASAKRYYRAIRAGENILPIQLKDCNTQKVRNNQVREK